MTPMDFQVTWSKVKVKLLVFERTSAQHLLFLRKKVLKHGTLDAPC